MNRNTYNFTWFGKTESVITEGWNGSNWEFTYRKQYTYTAGQNINTITYEAFNGSSWVISEIDRFSYLGGETTPHRSLLEASNDGITWTPYVAIDYTYTGTLPHTLTVLYYDNNYLQFVPAEELVVQSWGNATFTADYLFDMDIEQFKITDQRTNKIQQMFNHPQKFEYHYGFTTANWTFQDTLIYDALLSNGKRIAQNLI